MGTVNFTTTLELVNFTTAVAALVNSTTTIDNAKFLEQSVYFGAFAIPIGCIGAALNIFIIYAYFTRANRNQNKVNLLVVNQAMTDLVNCLVYCPAYAAVYISSQGYVAAHIVLLKLTIYTSLSSFLLIAIERFLLVWAPFFYRGVTRNKLYAAMGVSWSLAVIITAIDSIQGIICAYRACEMTLEIFKLIIFSVLMVLNIAYYIKARYVMKRSHRRVFHPSDEVQRTQEKKEERLFQYFF